jgi:NitT/TauT family transport system substrate-binding protein
MRRRGAWAALALVLLASLTLQGGTPRAAATTAPAASSAGDHARLAAPDRNVPAAFGATEGDRSGTIAARPRDLPAALAQPDRALPAAVVAPDRELPAVATQQRTTLRLGMLPVTAFLGMYLARDRGFLDEEGLAIDIQMMAGGAEILPAMIGGSLDVGVANAFSHVLARNQGFDVKAITGGAVEVRGAPTHAILVLPDAPFQSARDLEGRTIATNTLNNIDHLMQQIWLQNNGADPRRVSIVEVPFPQHPAALAQRRVDAIGPSEPFVTVAQSQGARVLAYHYTETNPVTLIAYLAATGDWLGRNADVARRFARAVHRGNQYLEANPEEKRTMAVQTLNLNPDVVGRLNFEQFDTRIDPAAIQWWIDAGRRFNLVDQPLDPADFLFETVR